MTRIEAGAKRVAVTCADGSVHRARACLSTLPLPVLKDLRVQGPVAPRQREAWARLPYGEVVIVTLRIEQPFWEKDGLPAGLWSDGLLERVFYMQPAGEAHGVLQIFINGQGAIALQGLAPTAVGAMVMRELARVRPSTAGAVSLGHVHDWNAQPYQRGHLLSYAPGDIGRYEALLAQPAGALYFAGEHCGKLMVGLEAACEAAENAVMRLLDDIDKA